MSPSFHWSVTSVALVVVLVGCAQAAIESKPFPEDAINLLTSANIAEDKSNIRAVDGVCRSPFGSVLHTEPSAAYHISRQASLSLSAASLIPEDFPQEFSIITTFRATNKDRSSLFTLYDKELEKVVMELEVAENSTVLHLNSNKHNPTFDVAMTDGKWHQAGFSVRKGVVTLVYDCKVIYTMVLEEEEELNLDFGGHLFLFNHPKSSAAFEGDVQQLVLLPNEEEAYDICLYTPECHGSFDFQYEAAEADFADTRQTLRQGGQGEPGFAGDKGIDGRDGENGKQGIPGQPGNVFVISLDAAPGVQTSNGQLQSMRTMLNQHMMAMKGVPGPQGFTGKTGEKGYQGYSGPKGKKKKVPTATLR